MVDLQPAPEDQSPASSEQARRADFDATLAGYRDELLSYVRQQLGHPEFADDLAQEALARMMKYRDMPEIEDRWQMLLRIARNLVIEFQRARARHQADQHVSLSDIDPLRMDGPPVEAIADARGALDALKRAIAELPPRCRLAFGLSRFGGLTNRQVAEKMGISVTGVEKHIARALEACRAAVGDREF